MFIISPILFAFVFEDSSVEAWRGKCLWQILGAQTEACVHVPLVLLSFFTKCVKI